jgi:hypothetical protein
MICCPNPPPNHHERQKNMNNRIARFAGITSITLLLAAVVSITMAAPTSPATPTQAQSPARVFVVPVTTSDDVLEDENHIQERKAALPAALPREYKMAVSKEAKKLKGYKKSLYRGKYYHPDQEKFRWCVMKRESHHNYRAANKSSSARGAYQFLDSQWREGLSYMMVKESKKSDDGLIANIRNLKGKPIHSWNRYYQDRAFFTALNYNGKWSGKKHWNATVPGTGC